MTGAFVANCARQGLPAHIARLLIAKLPALKPDTIVVAFGAVELQRAGLKGQVPDQDAFTQTMRRILTDLRARWPKAGILLTGIPPVRPDRFPLGRAPDVAALTAMNLNLATLAQTWPGMRFSNPGERLTTDAGGLARSMTHDGLHLTPEAYVQWQDQLWAEAQALQNAR